MSYYDDIKKLTLDPGARELAKIADAMEARVKVLEQKVAECCGSEGPDAAPKPATPPS